MDDKDMKILFNRKINKSDEDQRRIFWKKPKSKTKNTYLVTKLGSRRNRFDSDGLTRSTGRRRIIELAYQAKIKTIQVIIPVGRPGLVMQQMQPAKPWMMI